MTMKNVSKLCQIKITPSWEWLDQRDYENLRNISFCTKYLKVYTFSLVAVKKMCLTMQDTRVRSLGWEDPLEKEMTTHSSILAWKIPWTEEPGGLQSMGLQNSQT